MATTTTDGTITSQRSKEQMSQALTAKQRMFCEYYAISNNAQEAAKKAGYKDMCVIQKRLFKNALVLELIQELRKQMIQDYLVQTEYCVMQYKKLIDMAMKTGDYTGASLIVQKLSKLKQPLNANGITGQVTIKIG